MELTDELSPEEAQQLAEELAELAKQQAAALQTITYIRMFREQADRYAERQRRISEICGVLEKFKPE